MTTGPIRIGEHMDRHRRSPSILALAALVVAGGAWALEGLELPDLAAVLASLGDRVRVDALPFPGAGERRERAERREAVERGRERRLADAVGIQDRYRQDLHATGANAGNAHPVIGNCSNNAGQPRPVAIGVRPAVGIIQHGSPRQHHILPEVGMVCINSRIEQSNHGVSRGDNAPEDPVPADFWHGPLNTVMGVIRESFRLPFLIRFSPFDLWIRLVIL